MSWDASCMNGAVEGLPDCSWPDFCATVGIERPEWAQEFLRCLAGRYSVSGTPDLPHACRVMAESKAKNPYAVLVWTLMPDFHLMWPLMMTDDESVADNYYLLNVMRAQCQGAAKDWASLADDCMHDKELYSRVHVQVAARLGFAGVAEAIDMFPE